MPNNTFVSAQVNGQMTIRIKSKMQHTICHSVTKISPLPFQ